MSGWKWIFRILSLGFWRPRKQPLLRLIDCGAADDRPRAVSEQTPSHDAPSELCRQGMHDYDNPEAQHWTRRRRSYGAFAMQRQIRTCQREGCGRRHTRYRDVIPTLEGLTYSVWRDKPDFSGKRPTQPLKESSG